METLLGGNSMVPMSDGLAEQLARLPVGPVDPIGNNYSAINRGKGIGHDGHDGHDGQMVR